MLNFLTFREGTRGEYLKYGKAFAESIGARRGGEAKLVGKAVEEEGGDSNEEGWEEVCLRLSLSQLQCISIDYLGEGVEGRARRKDTRMGLIKRNPDRTSALSLPRTFRRHARLAGLSGGESEA